MSFAGELKRELFRLKLDNIYDKECELYAYLQTISSISLKGLGKINLVFETENASVAKRIFSIIKDTFDIYTEIAATKNNLRKGHFIYLLVIMDSNDSKKILDYFNIVDFSSGVEVNYEISTRILRNKSDIYNYLRGIFLSLGYITDPNKTYQLEFVFKNMVYAKNFLSIINKVGLKMNMTERKNMYVVYTKDSTCITDFLAMIGAHSAVLKIENVKAYKELKNNVNRKINCETANMDKTVNTALRQINAINKIIDKRGEDFLKEPLKTLSILRLENEDASLNEIANMYAPKKSRSTINSWFKKIEEIADKL